MSGFAIPIIAFFIFAAALGFSLLLHVRRSEREQDIIHGDLTDISEELGLRLHPKIPHFPRDAHHEGILFTFESTLSVHAEETPGAHEVEPIYIEYNVVRATFQTPIPCALSIRPKTGLDSFTTDIMAGDAKFDEYFHIESSDPELALLFLESELRATMLTYKELGGVVILDQESIAYEHPENFYGTTTLRELLRLHVKVVRSIQTTQQTNPTRDVAQNSA